MALITRVSRLFRADLHAVLDHIEEPDILLRQAVREMEEDLARDEQRCKLLRHEHGRLAARLDETAQALAAIGEELDVCFTSGKDDLARALIRRRLEAQRFGKFLAAKRDELDAAIEALQTRIDAHRRELDAMRQKAELFSADDAARQPGDMWQAPDFSVRDEDVEVAFLREQQHRRRP
jgi:phage shock protein A